MFLLVFIACVRSPSRSLVAHVFHRRCFVYVAFDCRVFDQAAAATMIGCRGMPHACSLVLAMAGALVPAGAAGPSREIDGATTRELLAHGGTHKQLEHTLRELHKRGLLQEDVRLHESNTLKRKLQESEEYHSNVVTPYGKVVQTMDLGEHSELRFWDYVNPFAWLHYMATLSSAFGDMMKRSHVEGRPCRLLIYADELIPGNPFRPEKSRTLLCIYWVFVDWPQHVLQRTFSWPVLGVLRSKIALGLEGGISALMRRILRIFFGTVGDSFHRGVTIPHRDGDFVVTAVFTGWLADLLGHKEIMEWKGTSGTKCCPNCVNLINKKRGERGMIGLDCSDSSLFQRSSSIDIWGIVDEIAAGFVNMNKTNFQKLQTQLGFNYSPHGLLLDVSLRGIYKPAEHMIRDWMHTVVSDGIANTEAPQLLV